jgi:hypothetical protein
MFLRRRSEREKFWNNGRLGLANFQVYKVRDFWWKAIKDSSSIQGLLEGRIGLITHNTNTNQIDEIL